MTRRVESKRLKDLIKLFAGMQKLQEQLRGLIAAKVDAMKRADISAVGDWCRQEQVLAKQLAEREVARRRIMDAMRKELGLPDRDARAVTVSQLASRMSESQRSTLQDAADRLRKVALQVVQANRVVGIVSREILNHLKWVFASVKPKEDQPLGYSGDGAPMGSGKMQIFETVA